jgi:ABC-type nitrate/sulfonate/bicarbonate transport system permease component
MNSREQAKEKNLFWISFLSILILILVWQFIVSAGIVPPTMLDSPSSVIKLFFDKLTNVNPDGATLGAHISASLQAILLGYLLALIIGIPLGLLMGWYAAIDGLVRPIFELVRPIPPVAWIPLAIFWFGIGMTGKVYIIFIGGLVPAVINAYTGVLMSNPTLIQMAKTYGASKWQIFKTVCIPSALPMIFGALQVALAICWTCLVAAELLASDVGLGYMITMGRRLLLPKLVILGMLMLGVTGFIIGYIVDRVEKRLVSGLRR